MAARPGPVLVTGANSGIGLATTLLLAKRGWEASGTVRSKAKATVSAGAAEAAGVDGSTSRRVVLDVGNDKAVVARWPELPAFYAVVNNAGYSELGAVEEVSAQEARAQLDVNVVAPAVVSSCALPAMRERGEGRIVMVSSIAGRAAIMPLNGWYHASKFALEALSDVLRMEVAGFGIKVVIVEPGFFRTGIGSSARDRADTRVGDDSSPYATAYRRATSGMDAIERLAPPPDAVARVDRVGDREPPTAAALPGRRRRARRSPPPIRSSRGRSPMRPRGLSPGSGAGRATYT